MSNAQTEEFHPSYSEWRHGGWYVRGVRYPSGGTGCVSQNYADRKWRIVCDPRGYDDAPTFKSRDDAARAEYAITQRKAAAPCACSADDPPHSSDCARHGYGKNSWDALLAHETAAIGIES